MAAKAREGGDHQEGRHGGLLLLVYKEYARPKDGKKVKVREEFRSRLLAKLREASERGEKLVLVTHSMGTIIAYDVLRNCADCPPVATLFTLGSPIGVTRGSGAAPCKRQGQGRLPTGAWPLDQRV